jgi:hypothetical protein
MYCRTREQALTLIDRLEFPVLLDVWTVDDVQESYMDEEDRPLLTEAQAAEVLARLARNFDAELGITNERIWNCAAHIFETSNKENRA